MHNALDEDEEGKSSDHSQACINQLPLIYSEWYALLSFFFRASLHHHLPA